MDNKHATAFILLVSVVVFVLCAYVKFTRETIRMNGVKYGMAGLVEQQIGNETLFIPVYRRLER